MSRHLREQESGRVSLPGFRRNKAKATTVLQQNATISPAIDLTDRTPLGEILIDLNQLEARELEAALTTQQVTGRRLGTILLDAEIIDERGLVRALSEQTGVPSIDLRRERPSAEALDLVGDSDARKLGFVPLDLTDGTLTVALADPTDELVRSYLAALPVRHVELRLATHEDIINTLNSAYRVLSGVAKQVDEFVAAAPVIEKKQDDELDNISGDAPVVAVVDRIVMQALRDRASDIHIEPTDVNVRIRFRIDGALKEVLSLPPALGPAIVSRIKVMADMNIIERRRPQDGQFQRKIDDRDLDVRVSTTATIFGEKAVLRLLDKRRSMLRLSDLGMPDDVHKSFSAIAHRPFGMVLCSGPTGSGKTTTLYATLGEISHSELNVMTIEDPVEYVFPDVNQIQINDQADITFASGLRAILRQDPDVILVGEVRDPETARIAVQSALTGHFVLSSVHATDAASALYRLLDMGIEPFLIASSVVTVVGQRLVRRICPSCAAPHEPTTQEKILYEELGGPPKWNFVKGTGCNYCSNTGFRDRIGVYEVLNVTDQVRQYIIDRRTPQELRELAISEGMRSLAEEAMNLVAADQTTIDEVIRNVYLGS